MFEVADHGVVRSTIEGEACFRTNFGDFDLFFLPRPQTFADFEIRESREDRGYLYRFAGTPRVWRANRFGTTFRQYFLKHDNHLLLSGREELRAKLKEALQVSSEP